MSSFNVPAVKAGLSSAVSPESGLVDRAQSGGNVPATTFSTMHAQRVGVASPIAEVPVSPPAEAVAVDRPFTLGDAILNAMDRMGQSAREHWKHVAAPLNPALGFNSTDLLNRQMHLQRFMLEVEFASLLSKQAAKTVDQISRTQ